MHSKTGPVSELATREKLSLIAAFRRRSTQLKIQAFGVLGLIVVLLGAAIWIFFSAAQITKQDVAADKSYRRSGEIEAHINEIKARIPDEPKLEPSDEDQKKYAKIIDDIRGIKAAFTSVLDAVNRSVLFNISDNKLPVDRGQFDLGKVLKFEGPNYFRVRRGIYYFEDLQGRKEAYIPDFYDTDNLIVFSKMISGDLDRIKDLNSKVVQLERLATDAETFRNTVSKNYLEKMGQWSASTQKDRQELKEFMDGLELVREQERKQRFGLAATTEDKDVSIPFLIQTNVTRFGPMLIILFFVNILVNLYRYSIRLSAYYDARADSLELIDIGINPEAFQKYAASVSPDALDIAKPPKLPTEYAIDIAKAALGKVGHGSKE